MSIPMFVAVRTDVAADVRIDVGGGEIGDCTILGASLFHQRLVAKVTRPDSDRLLEEITLECDSYEEMVESHEYNYRYEITEVPLS